MDDILLHKDDYVLKVRDLIDCYKYIQAMRLLHELLEMEPDHAVGHWLLGWLYGSQVRDFGNAEMHLDQALKFDPTLTEAYCDYLYLLKISGRYKDIIKLSQKAESFINGSNLDHVIFCQAEAYEMLGSFNESLTSYEKSIRLSSSSQTMMNSENGMSRVHKKMVQQELTAYINAATII